MNYPGGKGNLYQAIINLIPPHRVYIETHLGGGAILRHKLPARENIGIDIDREALAQVSSTIAGNNGDHVSIAGNGEAAAKFRFVSTDAVRWLEAYEFHGDEFIYADPPYVMAARRQHRQLYRYEYTFRQHIELLDTLASIPCRVMISGYWSGLYADRLKDWHNTSFEVRTRGGSWATEYLWMNYPPPTRLHDYSFLGDNYRERERIKRKKTRWVNRLKKMDLLERRAVLAAIDEVFEVG